MPAVVVVGSQWGDEGKGKVVDVLSSQADYVIRYQGGANAGHTLKVNEKEIILHLIPSGILHPQVSCVISSGVVLDLEALVQEVQTLKKLGHLLKPEQLLISDSATVLLPCHKQLDQAREQKAGVEKIGTTGKGIGPAYESRVSRKGLVFSDLFQAQELLHEKLKTAMEENTFLLKEYYKQSVSLSGTEELLSQLIKWREILSPYRSKHTSLEIHEALRDQKKVLFEGAQGSLLDLFHGTYPYVTSSSTLSSGAFSHSGIGPQSLDKVLAITKAYTTRVGLGPFPTECSSTEEGRYIQEKGMEFGASTGRVRRCGWLDLVALKYVIRLNGITSLALMKLYVLSGLEEIKICVSYTVNGKKVSEFPLLSTELESLKPNYKVFQGWKESLSSCRKEEDLPHQALQYISFIQKELDLPIDLISVGPGREETIWKQSLFKDLQKR